MSLSTTYTKTETDYKLQELQKLVVGGIKGNLKITDTAPTVQGLYRLSDIGTYTNLGGLVTTAGKINDAYFDGATWKLIAVEVPKAADGKTIESWTAKSYVVGSQVFYNGKIFEANANAIAADIPEVSNVWIEKLDSHKEIINKYSEFFITDENGKVILKVSENGLETTKLKLKSKELTEENLENLTNPSLAELIESSDFTVDDKFIVTDNHPSGKKNVIMRYDENGFDVAKLSDHFKSLIGNSTKLNKPINENYDADINMAIVYGQSLAVGGTTISPENFYTAQQFEQGVLINAIASITLTQANTESTQEVKFGNIVNMTATGSGLNARMLTKKWDELISTENGKDLSLFNFNLFGFVAGVPAGQWYQLSKYNENRTTKWVNDGIKGVFPTALSFGANSEGRAYLNLLQGVYFANKKANAQGKTFNVPVLCWVQGEASSDKDDTINEYYKKLDDIFNDLNSDIKSLTGQTNDVQFIIYQNSSFSIYQVPSSPNYVSGNYEGVPLACLKIAREKTNVRFATPLYPYSPSQSTSDKVHLSNVGYAMMSSHFGVQAKRAITDQVSKIVFYPKKIELFNDGINYYIKVKFDVPVKPLVFDETGDDGTNMKGHGVQPNMGFSILNGTIELITAVRLSADDSVVITCNGNPSGKDLTYAWTGVFGGGNLRDSQGEIITTTFNNSTYRLDNWCPFFRITL
jgi:hypothetical protein